MVQAIGGWFGSDNGDNKKLIDTMSPITPQAPAPAPIQPIQAPAIKPISPSVAPSTPKLAPIPLLNPNQNQQVTPPINPFGSTDQSITPVVTPKVSTVTQNTVDPRPFPQRVPGTVPLPRPVIPTSTNTPDSVPLGIAKTFYGGVNDLGSLASTAVGSVLPIGDANIYSPEGRANLVKNFQNETYNPATGQWFQTGQDAVKKVQTDATAGNTEKLAGDLGGSLLNAVSLAPIGAGVNAAKSVGSSAVEDALKTVAKSGLISGAYAGAGGATSAMQEGASAPDVLRAAAINAPIGAVVGAGLPLAAKGIEVGGKAVGRAIGNELTSGVASPGFAKIPGKKASSELVPQTKQPVEASLKPGQKSQPKLAPTVQELPKSTLKPSSKDIVAPGTVKTRGLVKSAQESKLVSDAAKAKLDGTYEVKSNKALQDSAAIRIAKDPQKAHEFALRTKSDEGTATAIALAQQYRKAGNHDLEASLINEKARRLTEAGREVQAAALMDKLSPQGVVSSAAQAIQKYNETAKKPIPELTGKMSKEFGDRADAIAKMPEGRDRNIAIAKLKEDVANLIPSSVASKAVTVWKAGLLTSPRTTMRNIVGNTAHAVAETAKDVPAAINDKMLSLKTGNRELTATMKGTAKGIGKGAQAAKDIYAMGYDPSKSIEKYDVNHITWGKNPVEQGLKKYTDFIYRNMGAQDKPFYHAAFARSLYDQAGAEAINAGKRGNKAFVENLVNNPTERMKVNATKDAQTAVFQNSNIGSKLASKVKTTLRDKNSGMGAVADVLMPFTGVPSSIAGQMIAYSPAGLVKGIAKDAKVLAGKVTKETLPDYQRQASQEIGRGVIGTGLLGLGAYLTSQGLMTGQPKDAAQSAQWQLEGKQANSVLIGGKWRSINSVGPEALVLLAGGKLGEGNDVGTAAANIGKDFLGQTFLSGVQAPLNAISDPARYAGSYIPNQAASVVPNIVKDAAKSIDPYQRETNVSGDIGSSTVNALKNSIPGLGESLPAKRDALGNPVKQEPSGPAAFVDLLNSKTPIDNPVVNELTRLDSIGQNATPSTLTNKQTILGQKITFTPQQLDKLEQDTGQPIQQQFSQLMATPEYKNASDTAKATALNNIVDQVRTSAKLDIANGNTSTPAIDTSKLTNNAQLTLAKDSFDKSGKNYQVVGDTVLRRDPQGNVTATPKIKYDYQVGQATLTQQKNHNDLGAWMKTAQSQMDSINKQLQDPSIDPLDALTLQNDAQTLQDNIDKYSSYGGFKKPTGASTGASKAKAAGDAIVAATKMTPHAKLGLKPTVKKAVYKGVPRVATSRAIATNKFAPIKISSKSAKGIKAGGSKVKTSKSPIPSYTTVSSRGSYINRA